MHRLARLLLLFALLAGRLPAAEDTLIATVRAADDERIAAMLAADPVRLAAILSDGLHYAHSSGFIDTKASFIESLAGRHVIYESAEYVQRDFIPAGPGVVLMQGRARFKAGRGAERTLLDLNFLAVWREEGGRWRFLAWQSARNPPPAAPGK
ncbi:MAG TPA: nuclear transport factor 2 family protein [Lacunisphaera sp.]